MPDDTPAEMDDFGADLNADIDPRMRLAELTELIGTGVDQMQQEIRSNVQRSAAGIQAGMGLFASPLRQSINQNVNTIRAGKNELDVSVLETLVGELASVIETSGNEFPDMFDDDVPLENCPPEFIDLSGLSLEEAARIVSRLRFECQRLFPDRHCLVDRIVGRNGRTCVRVIPDLETIEIIPPLPLPIVADDTIVEFEEVQQFCPPTHTNLGNIPEEQVIQILSRMLAECMETHDGRACFTDRTRLPNGDICVFVFPSPILPPPPPITECPDGAVNLGQLEGIQIANAVAELVLVCGSANPGRSCSANVSTLINGDVCVNVQLFDPELIIGDEFIGPPGVISIVPNGGDLCPPGFINTGQLGSPESNAEIDRLRTACEAANPGTPCCFEMNISINNEACVNFIADADVCCQLSGVANCPSPTPRPIPVPSPVPSPRPSPIPAPEPAPRCIPICPPDPPEDREECPPPVIWTNCETGEITCLPEGEEPEGDDWEAGGNLEDCCHVWFNCETGLFQVKLGSENPDGRVNFRESPWKEIGDKTINDICVECFDPQEDDDGDEDDSSGGPPKFDPFAACQFLAPGVAATLGPAFQFSKLLQAAVRPGVGDLFPLSLAGWLKTIFPKVVTNIDPITPVLDGAVRGITNFVQAVFAKQACGDPAHLGLRAAQTILGLLRQYLGEGFEDMLIPIRNQARFMCPTDSPTTSEADQAFLANEIPIDVWNCWVRAKNQDDKNQSAVMKSKQSRLGPNELVQLLRRKKMTKQEFSTRIRELAYLRGDEAEDFFELSRQIPPVSDLIRMMVRDAADEGAVARNRFDEDFEKKWTGQLKEWGEAQGVGEDFAKFVWRSHWSLPAPGQLAVMFHRGQFLDDGDPRKVTIEEIRETLKQQDIAPRWVDAFINTTFRLIPQRVLRRAFRFGVAKEEETFEQFRQQGFDNRNAKIMVDLTKKEAKDIALRTKWLPSFVDGTVTGPELDQLLEQDGVIPEFADDIKKRAAILSSRKMRKACIRSIHKRFMDAEFDGPQAVNELINLDVELNKADQLVKGWQCERDSQSKQVAASTLCRWVEDKLITAADFVVRLERLNYSRRDAERIAEACRLKVTRNELAAERKQRKAAESEDAKRETKERRNAAAAEKRKKTRSSRERKLLRSATRLANKLELDMPETLDSLKLTFDRWKTGSNVDPEDVLTAINEATSDRDVSSVASAIQTVDRIMNSQPVVDIPSG